MRWSTHSRGAGGGIKRGAAVAALLAIALAGCGGSGGHSTPDVFAAQGGPPGGSARHQPRPTAAMRRLAAALRSAFGPAGPASGAFVYDLTDHQQLFALRAGMQLPPASVEKLYTTVAALKQFAPDAVFHTTVRGTGHLGSHGVWHGDLYLRGDGDPTFGDGTFIRAWDLGNGANVADLVAQLGAAGIRRVTGAVIGDASLFDSSPGGPATHYAPDIPDFGGQLSALTYDHGAVMNGLSPGAFAARQLTMLMRAAHIQAKASPATAKTPPGADVLASVASPPLSVLLKLMNVPSDDLFAEMLTKQMGARFEDRGTIAAGADLIRQVIDTYGLRPTILDGSGLDRADRSSPHEVAALLRLIWHTDTASVLEDSLPLIGINGTTRRIAAGTPSAGQLRRQDGNPQQRDQPRWLLPQPGAPDAGVRSVHRRPEQHGRDPAARPDDRRDPAVLDARAVARENQRSVEVSAGFNRRELAAYLDRVGDRWPIDTALLGGARVADARGAPPQRERGPEYVVILVSGAFDGMPWLDRVYQAAALWDALEMGAPADVHCYTPVEFERKRVSLAVVKETAESGLDLLS